MNVALLTISSLSLVCSAGSLVILAKMAKEMQNAKTQIEKDVEEFKGKTNRNVNRIRSALGDLEL